jgi:hypothetical protein
VLGSDLHLSDKPPACREREHDWYAVQSRVMGEVADLCASHKAPFVFAGDLFDKFDVSSQLITLAMLRLPYEVYAVPGQHDLPHHRYDGLDKSAFGVLVAAGRVNLLEPGVPEGLRDLVLHGFPWGFEPKPCPPRHELDGRLHVAVCHHYVWTKSCSHPEARDDDRLGVMRRKVEGYDASLFGDNHKGFLDGKVLNGGALQRRVSDQLNYRPSVGLLHADGSIALHFLDVTRDVFDPTVKETKAAGPAVDARRFLSELKALGCELDFKDAVRRRLEGDGVAGAIADAVWECVNNAE